MLRRRRHVRVVSFRFAANQIAGLHQTYGCFFSAFKPIQLYHMLNHRKTGAKEMKWYSQKISYEQVWFIYEGDLI